MSSVGNKWRDIDFAELEFPLEVDIDNLKTFGSLDNLLRSYGYILCNHLNAVVVKHS